MSDKNMSSVGQGLMSFVDVLQTKVERSPDLTAQFHENVAQEEQADLEIRRFAFIAVALCAPRDVSQQEFENLITRSILDFVGFYTDLALRFMSREEVAACLQTYVSGQEAADILRGMGAYNLADLSVMPLEAPQQTPPAGKFDKKGGRFKF